MDTRVFPSLWEWERTCTLYGYGKRCPTLDGGTNMTKRYVVAATKRIRGDHRAGMVAFRRVTWLAHGKTHAATIAVALHANGWNVTRIAECETEGRYDNRR